MHFSVSTKRSVANILITGGAGFIGVNAAMRFLQKGWNVTVFDDFSRRGADLNVAFLREQFPEVSVIRGDVRSVEDVGRAFKHSYDAVLHLAGQVAVTTSVTHPRDDFTINALGTFNLLEAARSSSKPPIVLFASTNKVYGGLENIEVAEGERRYDFRDLTGGVSEGQPLDFHSPYGCSKGAADQYVRDYARIYGLRTVVFRQSCIYGQRQMGIEDQGWVAWFMIAGLFGRPVTIYGNGKQVRDLLYIDDLVDLYERAIERIEVASGKVYNIGGGPANTLSLLEFLDVLKELGLPLTHASAKERPGDQPIFISDNSKAQRDLQWSPRIGVSQGIPKLRDWLIEHKSALEAFYAS